MGWPLHVPLQTCTAEVDVAKAASTLALSVYAAQETPVVRLDRRAGPSGSTVVLLDAIFAEPIFHQRDECRQCRLCIRPLGGEIQKRAGASREHHEPHDRRATDRVTISRHGNGSIERLGTLHKFCRRPRMQAFDVADQHPRGRKPIRRLDISARHGSALQPECVRFHQRVPGSRL